MTHPGHTPVQSKVVHKQSANKTVRNEQSEQEVLLRRPRFEPAGYEPMVDGVDSSATSMAMAETKRFGFVFGLALPCQVFNWPDSMPFLPLPAFSVAELLAPMITERRSTPVRNPSWQIVLLSAVISLQYFDTLPTTSLVELVYKCPQQDTNLSTTLANCTV